MRKLRVFESISVDGYFTDRNGDMSWADAGREDAAARAQDVPDDGGILAGARQHSRCRMSRKA